MTRPCYWHADKHGTRYLIPGCMARINNPDIDECTCPSTAEQLATTQDELATARRELASLQSWHDAIVRAVYDHRDGTQIMRTASLRVTGEGIARATKEAG